MIDPFHISAAQWLISIFCGLLIGMSKSGLLGVILLIVPVMAMVFGGKPSTGIVLPMLIIADVFAIRKNTNGLITEVVSEITGE